MGDEQIEQRSRRPDGTARILCEPALVMDGLKKLHFYRKTPIDLTEATSTGGIISMCALVIMVYLFISQLVLFWQVQVTTDIVMDNSSGSQATMGIDFDVTLARLPCKYASVDIFDVLG